jgi:hypothetical protein
VSFAEPWLLDYRELLVGLGGEGFPSVGALNGVLPEGVVSGGGAALRFRAAEKLEGVEYERHVFETGEVPTRAGDWHDLFNALAWCRWPRLKAAMNALHYRHLPDGEGGRRGRLRDALTLLDESGALVVSAESALLEALASRRWDESFVARRAAWKSGRCLLCGHALLEKLRSPYKGITAHALLLEVDASAADEEDERLLPRIDAAVAEALLEGCLDAGPAALSPLPLAGIPGWWHASRQDAGFYADRRVFRPPPAAPGWTPAAPLRLENPGGS